MMTDHIPEYPLIESAADRIQAASGRRLVNITEAAVRAGELSLTDLQISAETLRAQAAVAHRAGYPRLAENLMRAAELTAVPNTEVLHMYELLRPGRASYAELLTLAEALEIHYHAPECARLVREAAEVYQTRGLTRK